MYETERMRMHLRFVSGAEAALAPKSRGDGWLQVEGGVWVGVCIAMSSIQVLLLQFHPLCVRHQNGATRVPMWANRHGGSTQVGKQWPAQSSPSR